MTLLALAAMQSVERVFTYVANRPLQSVALAGTFNNWDKNAQPMKLGEDGHTWSVTQRLPYGRVQYKFVLNGNDWIVDPKGRTVDDGNGNQNTELFVLPAGYEQPAEPADGKITASALSHRNAMPDLNYDRGRMTVRFRTRANDLAEVQLLDNTKPVPMRRVSRDEIEDVYEASIAIKPGEQSVYMFRLNDGARWHLYGENGLDGEGKGWWHLWPNGYRPFAVPDWPEAGVVYQIFPDRFANGSKANDLPNTVPWNTKPTYASRFGGDAAGVERHLPYIESLGVRTVYFTPVFDSPSNHRYDARTYTKIAPDFGTNAEFVRLTRELRARKIRTVMDFAFNHTATDGPWFMDLRTKGESSKYRDFYFPKSFPIQVKEPPNYVAWYGFPSMPKLNTGNPAVQKATLAAVDFWREGASLAGVRLDVGNEVDPSLWRALRTHVKATSPEFWICGENWGDGTPWFGGDQWDSQMGYQFRDAALAFFPNAASKPSQFLGRLMSIYSMYPPQVSRNLMNLLSSHDTPRFLTLCKGDAALHRLAATVQLTWPGAPMVYYGEELGMQGDRDPDNRRGMEWDKATPKNAMLGFYRTLIAARNANPALQHGDPIVLKADDAADTLAYARVLGGQAAVVALNRNSTQQTISLPVPTALRGKELLDVLSGRRIAASSPTLALILGPERAAVLVPASGPNLALPVPN